MRREDRDDIEQGVTESLTLVIDSEAHRMEAREICMTIVDHMAQTQVAVLEHMADMFTKTAQADPVARPGLLMAARSVREFAAWANDTP